MLVHSTSAVQSFQVALPPHPSLISAGVTIDDSVSLRKVHIPRYVLNEPMQDTLW